MSSGIEKFILPDIEERERVKEVEVKGWQVKVGDQIKEFDPISDVESDKAIATMSSRYEEKVTKMCYEVGDMTVVEKPLVHIEASEEDTPEKGGPSDDLKKETTKVIDIPKVGESIVAALPSVRQTA